MSRATPLPPQERRQAIVEATLPLLLAQGPDLSTREIARAAGVAEGTIFRAFETKDEIIEAAVHQALQPIDALTALQELPSGQALEERVTSVLSILTEEIKRTRSLLMHLVGAGFRPHHPGPSHSGPPGSQHDSRRVLMEGSVAALQPYSAELRVSPMVAAKLLAALALATSFQLGDDPTTTTPESIASVALHGIAEGEK